MIRNPVLPRRRQPEAVGVYSSRADGEVFVCLLILNELSERRLFGRAAWVDVEGMLLDSGDIRRILACIG